MTKERMTLREFFRPWRFKLLAGCLLADVLNFLYCIKDSFVTSFSYYYFPREKSKGDK